MRVHILIVMALAVAQMGCDSGPKMYRVAGDISWQGQPVADGNINFLPDDGNVHPVTAKIVNGKYDARVPAGKMKVEIFADKDLGYSEAMHQNVKTRLIPPEYNSLSKLTFDVQANNANKADFHLPLTN
jgi:hypothetical protein